LSELAWAAKEGELKVVKKAVNWDGLLVAAKAEKWVVNSACFAVEYSVVLTAVLLDVTKACSQAALKDERQADLWVVRWAAYSAASRADW
jgi:hypothetical protein